MNNTISSSSGTMNDFGRNEVSLGGFNPALLASTNGFLRNNTSVEMRALQEQIAHAKIPLLQVIDEALRLEEFGNPDECAASLRRRKNSIHQPLPGSSGEVGGSSMVFMNRSQTTSMRKHSPNAKPGSTGNDSTVATSTIGDDSTTMGKRANTTGGMVDSPPRTSESNRAVSFAQQQQQQHTKKNKEKKNDDDDDDEFNNDDDENNKRNIHTASSTSNSPTIPPGSRKSFRNQSPPDSASSGLFASYKTRKSIEEQKQHQEETGRTPESCRERAREQQLKRMEALKAERDSTKARSAYAERWRSFTEKRRQAQFTLLWQTLLLQVVMMRRWDRERRVRVASDRMAKSLVPLLKLRRSRRLNKQLRKEILEHFEVPPLTVDLLMTDKLLREFGRSHLASIIDKGKVTPYPRGYNLVYYGEPGRDCFVLVHGQVDVLVAKNTGNTEEGQEKIELVRKVTLPAPCVVGSLGMVRRERRIARLACSTDCIAYVIDHDDFMSGHIEPRIMEKAMEYARELHLKNMPETYSNSIVPEALERFYTMSKIPREKLVQISAVIRPTIALPGQYIIRAGQRSSSMFIMVEGKVDICPPAEDFQTPHHINTANAVHMIDCNQVTNYEFTKKKAKNYERTSKLDLLDVYRPYGYVPTCDTPEKLELGANGHKKYSPLNPQLSIVEEEHKAHNLMVTASLKAKATDSKTFILGGPRFLLLDEYNMNVIVRKTTDLFELTRDDFLRIMMTDPASLVATRELSLKFMSQHIERPRESDIAAALFAEFPNIKYSRRHLQDSAFGRRLQDRAVILPAGTPLQFNNHSKQHQDVLIVLRGEISRVSRPDTSRHHHHSHNHHGKGMMEDDSDHDHNNNNNNKSPSRRRNHHSHHHASSVTFSSSAGEGSSPLPLGRTGPPSRNNNQHLHGSAVFHNQSVMDKEKGTFSYSAHSAQTKEQYLIWPSLSHVFYSNQTFAQTVTKRIEGYRVSRGELLRWIIEIIGRDNEERQRLFVQSITKPYGGRLPAFFTMGIDDHVRETFMKWGAVKFLTKGDPGADAQVNNNNANHNSSTSDVTASSMNSSVTDMMPSASPNTNQPIQLLGAKQLQQLQQQHALMQQQQQNQRQNATPSSPGSKPLSQTQSQSSLGGGLVVSSSSSKQHQHNSTTTKQTTIESPQMTSLEIRNNANTTNNNNSSSSPKDLSSSVNNNTTGIRESGKKISFVMQDGQILEPSSVNNNSNNPNRRNSLTSLQNIVPEIINDDHQNKPDDSASATPQNYSTSISPTPPAMGSTGTFQQQNNQNNSKYTKFPSINHHHQSSNNHNNNNPSASARTQKPFSTDSYEAGSASYQLALQRFTRTMQEAIEEKNEKLMHDVAVKKRSSSRRHSSTSPSKNEQQLSASISHGRRRSRFGLSSKKSPTGEYYADHFESSAIVDEISKIDPGAIEARKLARGGVSHHPLAHLASAAKKNTTSATTSAEEDSHHHHHHHLESDNNKSNHASHGRRRGHSSSSTSFSTNNNNHHQFTTGPAWGTASHSSTEINTSSLLNTGGGTLAATARVSSSYHQHATTSTKNFGTVVGGSSTATSSLTDTVSIPPIASLWALPGSNDVEGNFHGRSTTARIMRNTNSKSDALITPRRRLLSQSAQRYMHDHHQHDQNTHSDVSHHHHHPPSTPFEVARQSAVERAAAAKEKQKRRHQ